MSAQTVYRSSPILLRLKTETETEHRRIEQVVSVPLVAGSLASYTALLERFYGFYVPFEERLLKISNWDAQQFDLRQRLKSSLLADDLRALGRVDVLDLPLCNDLPALNSPALAWGSMYVLEGSTLGGQIISRMIEKNLSLSGEAGGRFFYGYGSRTGEMWANFGAALTAYAQDSTCHEAIVAAAQDTFQKLRLWLEELSVNHE